MSAERSMPASHCPKRDDGDHREHRRTARRRRQSSGSVSAAATSRSLPCADATPSDQQDQRQQQVGEQRVTRSGGSRVSAHQQDGGDGDRSDHVGAQQAEAAPRAERAVVGAPT